MTNDAHDRHAVPAPGPGRRGRRPLLRAALCLASLAGAAATIDTRAEAAQGPAGGGSGVGIGQDPAGGGSGVGIGKDPAGDAIAFGIGQNPAGDAFGFGIGEERRYTIGPPGALEPGEHEVWIIRLDSIEGEPPGRRFHFFLEHEATRFPRGGANLFGGRDLETFHAAMDLVVNEHGFPLRIAYRGELSDASNAHGLEEVTLRFEDDGFAVHNRFAMGYRQYTSTLVSSPILDLAIPRGAYVSPSENPALYGLVVFGARIEEIGEIEYMALAPSTLARREPGRFSKSLRERGWSRRKLRFEERTTVDVGGVEEEAMRLRRSIGSWRDIYVRPDGTVLRADSPTRRMRSAFIRLLRPSEY